jgi:DNA-binding winged helix-turn-helix (wHTH) protein
MADILVSHAKEDHGRAQELVSFFTRHNWTVWWNEEVTPGEAIDLATEAELEAARIVVTVWSEYSVRSRLIRNTAYEAIESHCWIPLTFDSTKLPLRYREYQCIDMVGWPDLENPQAEHSLIHCCELLIDAETPTASVRDTNADVDIHSRKPVTNDNKEGHDFFLSNKQRSSQLAVFVTIRLGEWTIEEAQNRIHREGLTKKVTPKSMQVLMYLIRNEGIPVSIESILNQIWGDRIVVDSVVHRCISELREAFEDDFKEPKYIETISKRGYRIVAPILEIEKH